MKFMFVMVSLLMILALPTGCGSIKAPVIVPQGFIYQHTLAPLTVNYHATKARPVKSSSATAGFILIPINLLVCPPSFSYMTDKTLHQALQDGGIKTLSYADYESFSILGIYRQFTVYAYGE